MAPTIRTEPHVDPAQRTITGILIGAVVLLSIMVAVLGVTLRHVNNGGAGAQPCVAEPSLVPTASAGAGEAHLPSPSSISPSPLSTPTPPSTTTEAPKATVPITTAGTASAAVPTPAPNDVDAYLKFVQTIDQKRVALLTNPNAADPSTQPTDRNGATPSGNDWSSVITEFQNHSVPDSCSAFANEYLPFLTDCEGLAGKPEAVAQVAAEATRLDTDLAALYQSTLQKVKPFSITMPASLTSPAVSTGQ